MSETGETAKTQHFEAIRNDIRDEIKKRIEQRDKYSLQLTIALSTIVGLTFAKTGFEKVLIVAPLVSIYFTVLILYSYRVHGILAKYLRDVVEVELAKRIDVPLETQWENYYAKQRAPGIRRRFFLNSLWVMTLLSLLHLYFVAGSDSTFLAVLIVAGLAYVTAAAVITLRFWKS